MAQQSIGPTAESHPTLMDWAKRLDPDGSIAAIVELMNQTNEILDDAVYQEGNLPTGHRTTVRSDIPPGTWRKLNYGVKPQKSATQQVTDTIGMLENYAEVDKDLAMLNGNTPEFRLSEDRPIIEGLNQTIASTMFYGDTGIYPERFMGLAPRYDALGNPDKPGTRYGDHIIDGGSVAAGAVTSLWLVVWGPNTIFMTFPKGSKAGILNRDLGEQTLYDADGGRFQGYRTHYQIKAGMCVRDWRYIVRIANLDPADTTLGDFPYHLMIQAHNTIPTLGMGRAVWYCNRSLKTRLDLAAVEKTNAALSIDTVFGKPQTMFWKIPIKQCDAILNTEAVVS